LPLQVASSALQSSLSAWIDEAEKENTVQNPHIEHPTQNRVMAMFESSAAVFEVRTARF
jgi:hypothetical protein